MRTVMIIAFLALSACSFSKGEDEAKRFKMVDAQATHDLVGEQDRCNQARKVADGYLQDKSDERYAEWKRRSDIICLNVQLGREQAGL